MKFSKSLFKAYDIRGFAKSEITNDMAESMGREFADCLPTEGPVCVGYDMRPDSVGLAANLRSGLIKQGRDVYDLGEITSDMIYFAVGHLGAAGGAMVTASHSPGQYDGIKLCREDAKPISLEEGLSEISSNISLDKFRKAESVGKIESQNIIDAWVAHSLSFVDAQKIKPYHIAVDTGNGMGGLVMPYLESKWRVRVEPMFYEVDGTFPNHPANPLDEANLRDLATKIKRERLDFGLAFDGDGDRVFLVDEEGKVVSGSIMTAILADYFLKRFPDETIVYNANCSRVVEETIKSDGGHGVRVQTGHSFIKLAMRETEAIFAGEHSGHFYFRENWYSDSGLISALCAIAALSASGKSLSSLVSKYQKYVASGEQNFMIKDREKKLSELKQIYDSGKQNELDGLTVNFPNWWFIARPSNTEPYLRLNVEADSAELLQEKLAELRDVMTR